MINILIYGNTSFTNYTALSDTLYKFKQLDNTQVYMIHTSYMRDKINMKIRSKLMYFNYDFKTYGNNKNLYSAEAGWEFSKIYFKSNHPMFLFSSALKQLNKNVENIDIVILFANSTDDYLDKIIQTYPNAEYVTF